MDVTVLVKVNVYEISELVSLVQNGFYESWDVFR